MFKKLLAFLIKLFGGGGSTPPPDSGPPDPEPEPEPTAVRTDMLLRIKGTSITNLAGQPVRFDQAVQCCGFENPDGSWNSELPGVPNHRWPLISKEGMDYFAKFGLNAFHFRMGPFYGDADHESDWEDIGGPYTGGPGSPFNEAFFDTVKDAVSYAASKGWYVEINVIDTWYCKHAQWEDEDMPWDAAAIAACGRTTGNPTQKAWIDKVVGTFNKYGNVIWLIDNEGSEIQGQKREWFTWVRDTIRAAEAAEGSGHVHLIGTNSDFDDIADYAVTHARAALTSPLAGRWTTNNERNPEFSPEQEAANFKGARDRGLAYAFWRAGMRVAPMEKTLGLYKQIIEGDVQVGCFPPASEDPKWVDPPTPQGGMSNEVRNAVEAAKVEVGERCGALGPDGTVHSGCLDTIELVASNLRAKGFCAGRNDDALFIKDGSVWKEIHLVAFSTGCYSRDPNQYPKFTWTYSGASTSPCPDPQPPDLESWVVKVHTIGPNWTTVDATPLVRDTAYCNHFGFPGPRCPIRPEGDPARSACEQLAVGTPSWTGPGEVTENPYQYRVRRGTSGLVTVTGKNGVSGSVMVQA